MFPAELLLEPYAPPVEAGMSPRGRDPNTQPDGGFVAGAPWNMDFRGETYVADTYQGFGESQLPGGPGGGGQPTDWDPYQLGLQVTQPQVHGYSGSLQETGIPLALRAGSTIKFPTSGQTEPGFDPVLFELPLDQGFDVGWQEWFTVNQRQLFEEPPNVGSQTWPLPAAGYP